MAPVLLSVTSYTGHAARSPARFRLADDSRENGWSVGALVVVPMYIIMPHPYAAALRVLSREQKGLGKLKLAQR